MKSALNECARVRAHATVYAAQGQRLNAELMARDRAR